MNNKRALAREFRLITEEHAKSRSFLVRLLNHIEPVCNDDDRIFQDTIKRFFKDKLKERQSYDREDALLRYLSPTNTNPERKQ